MKIFVGLICTFFMLLLGGAFYWFQYRPSKIRSECVVEGKGKAHQVVFDAAWKSLNAYYTDLGQREFDELKNKKSYKPDDYTFYYKQCLSSKGISQ
jgi:hypothetical protein